MPWPITSPTVMVLATVLSTASLAQNPAQVQHDYQERERTRRDNDARDRKAAEERRNQEAADAHLKRNLSKDKQDGLTLGDATATAAAVALYLLLQEARRTSQVEQQRDLDWRRAGAVFQECGARFQQSKPMQAKIAEIRAATPKLDMRDPDYQSKFWKASSDYESLVGQPEITRTCQCVAGRSVRSFDDAEWVALGRQLQGTTQRAQPIWGTLPTERVREVFSPCANGRFFWGNLSWLY